MSYQGWLPAALRQSLDEDNPVCALRKQTAAMFEDFDNDISGRSSPFPVRPRVSETGGEACIFPERRWLTNKNVYVSATCNQKTIKREQTSNEDDKSKKERTKYQRVKQVLGSFHRFIRLPFDIRIASDTAQAAVKDGVLTVANQKSSEVTAKTRNTEVTHID